MTAPRQPVTRRPRKERVAEILAAATAEFREAGFEGTSMARIAQRARIVEGSIYRFFDNKHALLTRVVEVWYEDMLADYARLLAGITGTRNRLRFMIWKHLDTIRHEPDMCRLMFDHIRSAPDYRDTAVFRLNRLYTQRTTDIVRDGMERGELRQDLDLNTVRDLIYGGVEHTSWAFLRGEGDFDPDDTADAIVDLVLDGLNARQDPMSERLERIATRLEAVASRI